MVKIIKGTYLCKNKKGQRQRITEADGPQSFDPEEEARLVSIGVAEYVGKTAEKPAPVKPPEEPKKVVKKEVKPPVTAKPVKTKAKPAKKAETKPAEEEEAPPEFTASELV